jgi:hypothetical protein
VHQFIRGSAIYTPVRRWRLDRLARRPGTYPDWAALLHGFEDEWATARESESLKRVLIATSTGLHFTANTIDSLMAVALTLRGVKVDIAFCDAALPACQVIEHTLVPNVDRIARSGPKPDFCGVCIASADRLYAPTGLNIERFSDHLTEQDRVRAHQFSRTHSASDDIGDPRIDHARAGTLRFFGKSQLDGKPVTRAIFGRYLEAAFLTDRAARSLIPAGRYDAVVAHHGIYVPQGQIADITRETGTRLVTWHPAYRRGTVIFQHRDTYHREMITEPRTAWGAKPLTEIEDETLTTYLRDRETGAQDWITFQRKAPETEAQLLTDLSLDADKPVYLLAANVAWDARLHYPGSAYGDMIDWAVDTVRWFGEHPDRQLVVRCHPGEVMNSPKATDRLDESLRAAFPELPFNVRIVAPEMDTNTYALARLSRGVMIYNTKLGMELAARGMPVVVAGDAWIRDKGFSIDASDPHTYRQLLADPKTFDPLRPEAVEDARRYAYHFFFRRCIDIGALDPDAGWPLTALAPDAFARARPGADDGLDVVCEGIMNATPFESRPQADSNSRGRPRT